MGFRARMSRSAGDLSSATNAGIERHISADDQKVPRRGGASGREGDEKPEGFGKNGGPNSGRTDLNPASFGRCGIGHVRNAAEHVAGELRGFRHVEGLQIG